MPNQARFLDFMDMIDGGGAGRMGDKFEGGGIFSTLANMIATPYGSEDEARRKRREAAYRAAGLLEMEAPKEAKVVRTGDGRPKPTKPSPKQLAAARMAEMERKRGLQQDVFDPRDQQGATSFRVPVAPVNPYAVGGGFPMTTKPSYAIDDRSGPVYTPAPSYANMGMGEAGRGAPSGAPAYTPAQPYATMSMGEAGRTAADMLPTIYPSQAAQVDAVNQANREAMRQSMSGVPRTQYDIMSRQQRSEQGLPVGGLDLAYAGADAFKQYSGRGMSTGDPEFDAFMARARNDAQFASIIDSPQTMRNIFNMYKQQRAAQAGM